MQPEGPYRFTEVMGVCQVGKVWWAVDGQDRLVTVAVLDQVVAEDTAWRRAFSGMADTLGAPGGTGRSYLAADFAAPAPWVAYAADGGPGADHLFFALGQEIRSEQADGDSADAALSPSEQSQPAPWALQGDPRQAQQVSSPPQQVPVPQQVSAPPQQVSSPPVSSPPVSSPPVSVPPVSVPPVSSPPVSVPPVSAYPYSVSAPPHDPFTSPARRIVPSEPRPRRTGRWLGIVALVLLMVVSAGGAFIWARSDGTAKPQSVPGTSLPPPPVPTAPPQSPGIEPPTAGAWPKGWPKFTPADSVRTFSDLDGLGFTVKAPAEWQCTPAGRAEGFVKYNCGVPGGQSEIGGELIVRDCPLPCDEQRQTAMRQAEDAWGLQWVRGGQFVAYADSSKLQIDGERRYGLVVVAYWRGGSSGRIDRQLVFRMTSPVDGAGRLRRVANHLRDTLIF
ncbi:hypothetical protein OG799_22045 [Micromonospora sp. NBC_00898]|uniref:hypothetical protein n=1 Tax=Micromonospora sp. NBC_00898 TaxID=2975981 RepID=UPI003868CEB2|nr:hypothetical protein OG799_22045 [Micromonospora sp. NBC_00898]